MVYFIWAGETHKCLDSLHQDPLLNVTSGGGGGGQMYYRIRILNTQRLGLLREGLGKSVPRDLRDARSDLAHKKLIMYL